MSLLLVVPLALPLGLGALLLATAPPLVVQRGIGLVGVLGVLGSGLTLLAVTAGGHVAATAVGGWPPPYGIVLVADRLATLMVTLTGLLGLGVLVYVAGSGTDRLGQQFHALLQLQLFGLAGAFLTGDLFNLFVFFEVLLIASYGLLVQGGGARRSRAALHYVVLNLIASSLFLMGVALVYAAAGTLNLADLAGRLHGLGAGDAGLAGAGLLLVATVFALKAALLPLHTWLVPAYAAALGPVAALFAILTKVGIYALLRLLWIVQGSDAGTADGGVADLPLATLMAVAGLLTLAAGTAGVLAAVDLRAMTAYLILVSVGTLLAGVAADSAAGLSAALVYLVHTTLVTAGLLLLADRISDRRRQAARLVPGDQPRSAALLGVLFLLGTIAIAGLPPLSGFIGKALILDAVHAAGDGVPGWPVTWAAVLGSSLLVLLGLSRAGVLLFWQGSPRVDTSARPAGRGEPLATAATMALLAASPLIVAFAGPLTAFTGATGAQLRDGRDYVAAVAELQPMPRPLPPMRPIRPAGGAMP